MTLLREPLFHFVAAGIILFAAFAIFEGDDQAGNENAVIVDRRALLTFLQYRANAFDAETFGAALDAMSDDELQDVIDAYIDEEILYREARDLGLEQSDNIIRQRMVQKMNFLIGDLTTISQPPDRRILADYFADNIESYAIQPWATFTHVFFDSGKRGPDEALAAAEEMLQRLNRTGAQFNDALPFGDSFPFLRNYVERTIEYIAGHFGYGFAAELEAMEPSAGEWQGPIRSAYGQHIVLLTRNEARAYPALDDVLSEVERDLADQLSRQAVTEMTRQIRQRYDIVIGEIRTGRAP